VEADEVVDVGDGADENEVDTHEDEQPRHRPSSVWHLARPLPRRRLPLPRPDEIRSG
jgi:hypothetical protein